MPYLQAPEQVDSRIANHVLRALGGDEYEALRPHLEDVELPLGEVLARAGEPLAHIYFPDSGVISLVAQGGGGQTVEVAFTGSEGIAGGLMLLTPSVVPYSFVVNLPGRAHRVAYETARRMLVPEGRLVLMIHRSLRLLVVQLTQTAICNRFHSPRQRLARWLALASDRMGGGVFPMTHEVMASMVGGARSMVTQASSELRDRGAVEYRRGSMRILDPAVLHAEACECYQVVTRAMQEMMEA